MNLLGYLKIDKSQRYFILEYNQQTLPPAVPLAVTIVTMSCGYDDGYDNGDDDGDDCISLYFPGFKKIIIFKEPWKALEKNHFRGLALESPGILLI